MEGMRRSRSFGLLIAALLAWSGRTARADVTEPPGNFDPALYGKVAVLHWAPRVPTPLGATPEAAERYKAQNRRELTRLVREARDRGAEWVITPELAVTGYPEVDWTGRADLAPYVERIPGPSTREFAALADALDIHLHLGLPEVDPATGRYHNSVAVLGPGGELIAVHRKTAFYGGEGAYFSLGVRQTVYRGPFGTMGAGICAEIYSGPALSAWRAAGVTALGLSNSWAVTGGMAWWQRGARTLRAWVLASNHPYFPDAGVVNPDGTTQSHVRGKAEIAYGWVPRAGKATGPSVAR